MINVAQQRAALDSSDGEIIGVRRCDYAALLTEVDAGNQARRDLSRLKAVISVVAIAADQAPTPMVSA